MTGNQTPGYISDNSRTQGDTKTALENMVLFAGEHLGAAAETTLTTSGNAITPPVNAGMLFSVDTSGGAGYLDNIVATNVPDGRLLLIRCANPSANPVTVRNNQAGSLPILLSTGSTYVFASTKQWLLLKRTGSNFEEITRFYGDQTSAFISSLGFGTAASANTGTSSSNVPTISQADARYAALAGSTSQAFNVAGSPSGNNAVNKTVADSTYAPVAGNSSANFSVAAPTSASHAANKSYVDSKLGAPFESNDTLAAGTTFSHVHLLGYTPKRLWSTLTCLTAEGGWSVGEEVTPVSCSFTATTNGNNTSLGIVMYADGTNLSGITGKQGMLIFNKSNGQAFVVTPANWTLNMYAE